MTVRARAARAVLARWLATRGWRAASFQRAVWTRYLDGESGLLQAPTGSGKTLAVFGGPVLEALQARERPTGARNAAGPQVLWVTPLKALAADTARALRDVVDGVGLPWQVGVRTGDASARDKRLARQGRLDVLVITPESLALLLSYADARGSLDGLRSVIVDEWHELLGSKRGVLLQLVLARLRARNPALRIWGVSATLGNLEQARDVLLPHVPQAAIVQAAPRRPFRLRTLVPEASERFPWAGHVGLGQLARVLKALMSASTSLLFTHTRAQAELWHRALSSVWPEDLDTLALHHGSLAPPLRAAAEQGLRDGSLRCVVATSSLDLGVDFPAVEQVLQLGSPKGVARLLQRAGRARHRPGEAGTVVGVPAQALELFEYAAVRIAVAKGIVEPRRPPVLCLDVLAQHCVTLAVGGGFEADALYREIVGTHAFRALSHAQWQSVLDFIAHGSPALEIYPDYHRVARDDAGCWRVTDRRIAFRHRLSIGTIVGEGMVEVVFLRGGRLGAVDEAFVSRLRPGDAFHFAGRSLSLVRLEGMTAYVRTARARAGAVPQWSGTRLPLSGPLAAEVEALFSAPADVAPEVRAAQPVLALQAALSALPGTGRLLVECIALHGKVHLAFYPFAGSQVHEALAALVALRWGRLVPNSFVFAVNDYGVLVSAAQPTHLDEPLWRMLWQPDGLEADLDAAFNLAELARRQFREIARVAGLLVPSLPGRGTRSTRQVQASSGLLFDVFSRYDPGHMLLEQAAREAKEVLLDVPRLREVLADCAGRTLVLTRPAGLTPLSFPLWAETARGRLSTEDWQTRIRRAAAQLERRHGR